MPNYSRKKWTILWISLVIAILLFFFCNVYYDFLATYPVGYGFLEAFLKGEGLRAYTYAGKILQQSGDSTIEHMLPVYNALVYIPFAIWSIPIWIINRFCTINLWAPGIILWYKSLLLFATVGAGYVLRKILMRHGKAADESLFLFVSSPLIVLMIFDMSQYDIIGLLLLLLAIDELDAQRSITLRFILFASLGTAFKGLPFFLIVPLILLVEKRIWRDIAYTVSALLFMILNPIVFRGDLEYVANSGYTDKGWMSFLINTTIPGGTDSIPVFILLWAFICLWAYCIDNKDKFVEDVAWLGTATYGAFLVFVFVHPQWSIMIIPFVIMIIAFHGENVYINTILEFLTMAFLTLFFILRYPNVFLNNFSMQFLLTKRFNILNYKGVSFADYWYRYLGMDLNKAIFGLFAACIVGFIFINYPNRKRNIISRDTSILLFPIRVCFLYGFWILDFCFNNIYIAEKIEAHLW